MKVCILKESGYYESLIGLSLSFNTTVGKAAEVSRKLYNKDGGHNKFLESMLLWVDVTAPRFFWSEGDTYRISTKQSESTMHTIQKRLLTQDDFEVTIKQTMLDIVNDNILLYRETKSIKDLVTLKTELPEGFLQRRIWVFSYKTLRNMITQRHNHRLPQWQHFCDYLLENAEHQEYLDDLKQHKKD